MIKKFEKGEIYKNSKVLDMDDLWKSGDGGRTEVLERYLSSLCCDECMTEDFLNFLCVDPKFREKLNRPYEKTLTGERPNFKVLTL